MIALLRFHAASGTRLALRASVPIVGAFVIAVGMSQYPGATLVMLGEDVAAESLGPLYVIGATALAIAVASWAVPRLVAGADGWMRSLPVDTHTHRRALAAGAAIAVGPLILVAAALMAGAIVQSRQWNGARAASLIPFALGAAYAALPLRRSFAASPLAACGAALAVSGGWAGVAAGTLLVVAADAVGGAPGAVRRARTQRSAPARTVPWRIATRAVGGSFLGAWAAGAVPLLAGALFLANNDLPGPLAGRAARLAIGLSIVATLAVLADRLALARPVWPWVRSLPWTSRRRAGDDALVLAALTAPVWIAGCFIDPLSTLATGAAVPFVALRAAAAMRRETTGHTAAAGAILVEGGLGAVLFALVPWAALAAAAATPWALRQAGEREAALRVSRWSALHHLAAGDPASWRGR